MLEIEWFLRRTGQANLRRELQMNSVGGTNRHPSSIEISYCGRYNWIVCNPLSVNAHSYTKCGYVSNFRTFAVF